MQLQIKKISQKTFSLGELSHAAVVVTLSPNLLVFENHEFIGRKNTVMAVRPSNLFR